MCKVLCLIWGTYKDQQWIDIVSAYVMCELIIRRKDSGTALLVES